MVIWIIGLSGSGKTTLAKKVVADARETSSLESKKTVLIDGDVIREMFDNDIGYSMQGRLTNAKRICQLGKFLDSQGINVVCAILSIFPETRKWNRENIVDYNEVYIKVPLDILEKRDTNNLYSQAKAGKIKNVVGIDIPFPEPKNPDLIIENNIETEDFNSMLEKIMSLESINKILR